MTQTLVVRASEAAERAEMAIAAAEARMQDAHGRAVLAEFGHLLDDRAPLDAPESFARVKADSGQ